MRRIALLFGLLALNFNAYPVENSLNSAIGKTLEKRSKTSVTSASSPIIYGGQDFSHTLIAIANESILTTQRPILLG